jgi:exodeoxyribonuclease V alpha subunit
LFPSTAVAPAGLSAERIRELLARLLSAAAGGEGAIAMETLRLSEGEKRAIGELPRLFAQENGLLLLPRYAHQLREMRVFFEARAGNAPALFEDGSVRAHLDHLLPEETVVEPGTGTVLFNSRHQRLAIAALVDARVGVLTGGPGTGKTTTAAALLALRHRLEPGLNAEQVLVTAPTGKAACRIGEALSRSTQHLRGLDPREKEFLQSIRCLTLHRALEWGPEPPERNGPFRRNAYRRLDARVVLVDEASMVDLSLMYALLRALREDASLLLLGDSDQLKSVEVGGILAELVARSAAGAATGLPSALHQRLCVRLGLAETAVHAAFREGLPGQSVAAGLAPLPGLTVGLKYSRRAMHAPWVLELAEVTRPEAKSGIQELAAVFEREAQKPVPQLAWRETASARTCLTHCSEHWKKWAVRARDWRRLVSADPRHFEREVAEEALRELGNFQLLCSTNAQVEEANAAGRRVLYGARAVLADQLPHGCPVLITENDRSLELSNGDVGIALAESEGEPAPVALFAGSDGVPRLIPMAQLPPHRAALGLTIHKSQGSEWKHIVIQLPEDGASQVLSRNLLYTAITRSSGRIELFGPRSSLAAVLEG